MGPRIVNAVPAALLTGTMGSQRDYDTMTKKPALPTSIAGLTPLELARKIPVAEAAKINSVHVETFKKRYSHLIRRIGQRRLFVTVHDAIMLPPPPGRGS
jgi:hypothetical protein